MAEALNQSDKAQYHRVSILPAGGAPFYFTNWDTPLDPGGLNFLSLPRMEIDPAPNVGAFQERSSKIRMLIEPLTTALLDPMTRGTPFAPTQIKVEEVIDPTRSGDSGQTEVVINGQVFRTRRNINGEAGLVELEIKNGKDTLDVALGFPINPFCVWRLNGRGCNESTHGPTNYDSQVISGTVDGKLLRITDTSLLLDLPGTLSWSKGYVSRGGVNVGIRYYDKAQDGQVAKVFQMMRQPPKEWTGQAITFFPGCTKSLTGDSGCRDWQNEEGFAGGAYKTAGYNPITENPG